MNVKRFKGRQLYDEQTKKRTTQAVLFKHIKQGGEVKVIDSVTKLDITDLILRNALLKQQFTVERLYEIIRTGN